MRPFASPAYAILPVRFRYSADVAAGHDTHLLALLFPLFIQKLPIPVRDGTEPDISLVANPIAVRTPFCAFLYLWASFAGTGTGFAVFRYTHLMLLLSCSPLFIIQKTKPQAQPDFRIVLGLCSSIQLLRRNQNSHSMRRM